MPSTPGSCKNNDRAANHPLALLPSILLRLHCVLRDLTVQHLDLILVPTLIWQIKPAMFQRMRSALILATAIFWTRLWFWVIGSFWEMVYHHFFPGWSRWLIPFYQAGLTGCRSHHCLFRVHLLLVCYYHHGGAVLRFSALAESPSCDRSVCLDRPDIVELPAP